MVLASSRPPLFLVFGPSKSGTTWVQKMLDAHPETSCEFQPGLLRLKGIEKAPGMGVTRASGTPYEGIFADEQSENEYRTRANFLTSIDFLRPDYLDDLLTDSDDATRRRLTGLHRRMVRGVIEAYLAETSSKPIRGYKMHVDIDFLIEVFPDARVILVVRDGRDVCVSHRHHHLRQGVYYQGDERFALLRQLNRSAVSRRVTKAMTSRLPALKNVLFRDLGTGPLFSRASLEKAATDWTVVLEYILTRRDRYPENHLLVRYEDMLDDAQGELRRMLEFLGADSSQASVDRVVEETSMPRLKRGKEGGFFRKGVSGDWRNAFTPADVDHFKAIAGKWLVELGYERDDDWKL